MIPQTTLILTPSMNNGLLAVIIAVFLSSNGALAAGKGCKDAVDNIRGLIKAVQINASRVPADARVLFEYREDPSSKIAVTKEFPVCDAVNRSRNKGLFYSHLAPPKDGTTKVELGVCLSAHPCIISVRELSR